MVGGGKELAAGFNGSGGTTSIRPVEEGEFREEPVVSMPPDWVMTYVFRTSPDGDVSSMVMRDMTMVGGRRSSCWSLGVNVELGAVYKRSAQVLSVSNSIDSTVCLRFFSLLSGLSALARCHLDPRRMACCRRAGSYLCKTVSRWLLPLASTMELFVGRSRVVTARRGRTHGKGESRRVAI